MQNMAKQTQQVGLESPLTSNQSFDAPNPFIVPNLSQAFSQGASAPS
jgi:hypothetical protein